MPQQFSAAADVDDPWAPPSRDSKSQQQSSSTSPFPMTTLASQWAGTFLQSTKHTVQSWTVRKYTLPDKHVASQVLMYRQLLHTKCRPGLTLSREYQGTPAQQAVLHMPWWSQGILQTNKMTISYQNLVARLWISGAVKPYGEDWQSYYVVPPTTSTTTTITNKPTIAANDNDNVDDNTNHTTETQKVDAADISGGGEETKESTQPTNGATTTTPPPTTEELKHMTPEQARFRAPVPHQHWVDRLGFQQEDPVTDFRSGGVLSLAMMVHLVESCPETFARFVLDGDAAVFPFALTCINITDMMAKFLMLSKAVDRMDALLSQKPFWRMFADPQAMLVCQETAMQLTADVVVEMEQERRATLPTMKPVTVFDFAHVLAIVERRMEYDYLMAGPTSSADLKQIHAQNKLKYQAQLQQRIRQQQQQQQQPAAVASEPKSHRPQPTQNSATASNNSSNNNNDKNSKEGGGGVNIWKHRAASVAGNVWQKVKAPVERYHPISARHAAHSATQTTTTTTTTAAPPPPDFLYEPTIAQLDENILPPLPTTTTTTGNDHLNTVPLVQDDKEKKDAIITAAAVTMNDNEESGNFINDDFISTWTIGDVGEDDDDQNNNINNGEEPLDGAVDVQL